MKVLVVGAGFTGASAARVLADAGHQVVLIDHRGKVGGNASDVYVKGVGYVSEYGPHLFHTNSDRIWQWLSRFTEWTAYEHRVVSYVSGTMVPMPIIIDTLNRLFGLSIETPEEMKETLEKMRQPIQNIVTSRDVLLNGVGSTIATLLFDGYTKKQWGVYPSDLDASVIRRIPIRYNNDARYFTDKYQGQPVNGYTAMFKGMTEHSHIHFEPRAYEHGEFQHFDHTIYTGCIDEFHGKVYGPLQYRSLHFKYNNVLGKMNVFEEIAASSGYVTTNFPMEGSMTRITNYTLLNGMDGPPFLCSEFPSAEGPPYYPFPNSHNRARYDMYARLQESFPTVHMCGRLGSYAYYNMDQACSQGIAVAKRLLGEKDADQ